MANQKSSSNVILFTFVALLLYSALYFTGKFYGGSIPVLKSIYGQIRSYWAMFTFLEFLALASVVVDGIIKFDKINQKLKSGRVVLTILLGLAFGTKIVYAIMEIYMVGEVQ
jgi:hypothetical protein